MKKTSTLMIAGSLLLGVSGVAIAGPSASESSQQLSQTQLQDRSAMNPDYQERQRAHQQRLANAKTPEERARIQAEWDRMNQQGQLPPADGNVRTGPGTVTNPTDRVAPSDGGESRGD